MLCYKLNSSQPDIAPLPPPPKKQKAGVMSLFHPVDACADFRSLLIELQFC